MLRERRDSSNRYPCDLCGMTGKRLEMHELIHRGSTTGHEAARNASFNRVLCAMLCRDCHERAPRKQTERILWEKAVARYGKDAVREAVEEVKKYAPHIIPGWRPE